MDEWDRVRELWIRQQRGEPPNEDATPREQHYYQLIERIEASNRESEQVAAAQSAGRYRFRLEARESCFRPYRGPEGG